MEALGEDVEEENRFGLRVGDAVAVLPFPGQHSGYSDCVCVPDLGYLVRLPEDFPLTEEAVVVIGGARLAMAAAERLRGIGGEGKRKILVVGEKPLLLWFIHLLPLAKVDEGTEITVATDSESLIGEKKKYSK